MYNYLITPEERPKVYFSSYLETKISASEEHILSLFPASFHRFSLKFILGDPGAVNGGARKINLRNERFHESLQRACKLS